MLCKVKPTDIKPSQWDRWLDVFRRTKKLFRADVPVYLVKTRVKSLFLRSLRFLNLDTYHWALRIRKKHYHLTTNGTRSKFGFTQKPIPRTKVVAEVFIGMTRMTNGEVVHKGDPILHIFKKMLIILAKLLLKELERQHGSYSLLSANCQDFAKILADLAELIKPDDIKDAIDGSRNRPDDGQAQKQAKQMKNVEKVKKVTQVKKEEQRRNRFTLTVSAKKT